MKTNPQFIPRTIDDEADKFENIVEFWKDETRAIGNAEKLLEQVALVLSKRKRNIRAFRGQLMQYQAVKESLDLPMI